MRLRLIRYGYFPFGTFGRLRIEGDDGALLEETLTTVERPWLGNEPNVSCIPEGVYPLASRRFNRGGYEAIHVLDVPGRSLILFHKANWPSELEGCIAPNLRIGLGSAGCPLRGFDSAPAFALLMDHFGAAEHASLTVSSVRAELPREPGEP